MGKSWTSQWILSSDLVSLTLDFLAIIKPEGFYNPRKFPTLFYPHRHFWINPKNAIGLSRKHRYGNPLISLEKNLVNIPHISTFMVDVPYLCYFAGGYSSTSTLAAGPSSEVDAACSNISSSASCQPRWRSLWRCPALFADTLWYFNIAIENCHL